MLQLYCGCIVHILALTGFIAIFFSEFGFAQYLSLPSNPKQRPCHTSPPNLHFQTMLSSPVTWLHCYTYMSVTDMYVHCHNRFTIQNPTLILCYYACAIWINLVPALLYFCSSVSIQYNTWSRRALKDGEGL